MKIDAVTGHAVLDSNGLPAIEVTIRLESGIAARAIAPRGSTTGQYEASVLEDQDAAGLLTAVEPALRAVHDVVGPALRRADITDQSAIDAMLCDLDGTPNKSVLGGNVCVATSMAAAKAGAFVKGVSVARHLHHNGQGHLPTPMFNMIDGSRACGSAVGGIEFLFLPSRRLPPAKALEMGMAVRQELRRILQHNGVVPADSAQGAYEVAAADCTGPLGFILEAALRTGLEPGRDFGLGLDLAASDYFQAGGYVFGWPAETGAPPASKPMPHTRLAEVYAALLARYPISYIEDAFAETDEAGWAAFMAQHADGLHIVGDDLFASSAERIRQGAAKRLANAVLIKPNQVGTVSETLQAIRVAQTCGIQVMVSQRSGENDDDFITHLAIAGGALYLKAGGLSRMDRIVKYNTLLRSDDAASPSYIN